MDSNNLYMQERIISMAQSLQHGSLLVVDKGFAELLEAGVGLQPLLGTMYASHVCSAHLVSVECIGMKQ